MCRRHNSARSALLLRGATRACVCAAARCAAAPLRRAARRSRLQNAAAAPCGCARSCGALAAARGPCAPAPRGRGSNTSGARFALRVSEHARAAKTGAAFAACDGVLLAHAGSAQRRFRGVVAVTYGVLRAMLWSTARRSALGRGYTAGSAARPGAARGASGKQTLSRQLSFRPHRCDRWSLAAHGTRGATRYRRERAWDQWRSRPHGSRTRRPAQGHAPTPHQPAPRSSHCPQSC